MTFWVENLCHRSMSSKDLEFSVYFDRLRHSRKVVIGQVYSLLGSARNTQMWARQSKASIFQSLLSESLPG